MNFENISFQTDGPVAIVTLERPSVKNCVDGDTAAELADAFRQFDDDDSLSVAILTGSDNAFCAGADLKAIGTNRSNRVESAGDGPMGSREWEVARVVRVAEDRRLKVFRSVAVEAL